MKKIEKAVCACCEKDRMVFIFVTNRKGNIETDTQFMVEDSYDNSPYKPGHLMTQKELLEVITDNSEIDFMCMDCLDECSDFQIKLTGEDSKYCSGVSGKEILRDILGEAITPDHAIWTIDDLENMMNTSKEKTK